MKKRIMHILNSSSFSGAENVVITLVEGFRKFHNDTEFIYVSPEGSISEVLKEKSICYEPVQSLSASEVKRVIKKVKPDIIHAHDFTASIVAAFCCKKIPVISHIHNNTPWIGRYCINSFIYGLSCIKYKHIFGVSSSVFDEYVFGKLIRKKASVIGNPVDISRIIGMAEESTDKERYDICFLGRLSEPKDPVRFVEIINSLNEIVPVKAVMVGEGSCRTLVEKKIFEYDLKDEITLKGFVKNPYGILKNSKVLCAPSKWEGFGIMAVEALTLGKPVVAAPVGGLVDIVTKDCGSLCRTDKEYIDFLYKLITDDTFYEELSRGAFKRTGELDNIKDYCHSLAEIYKKL